MPIFLSLLLLLIVSPLQAKKIVIFSCSSGGGHMATAGALSHILQEDFEIVIASPQDDLFPASNKIYNYHLSYGHYSLLNTGYFFRELALPLFFLFQEPRMAAYIQECVEREKPDLLISVVPYGNQVMVDIANQYQIPFLIVTSDNDIRHWIYGLRDKDLQRMQITISRDLPCTTSSLVTHGFLPSQIKITGLAVRSDFYDKKNKELLCQRLQIPSEKAKIFLMFGGSGNAKIVNYIEKIDRCQKGVHFIACAGRNRELARKLHGMDVREGNSMTVVEFTPSISDYMAIADLVITKAGPGSIEEALILERPILVDEMQDVCLWEKINGEIVSSYGVGRVIKDIEDLPEAISYYLNNSSLIEENYKKVPKNHFPEKIREVIFSIL